MSKKVIKGVIYAIFPTLFNVMFFLIGGASHTVAVWISYACIHLSYLLMIATPSLFRNARCEAFSPYAAKAISSCYFTIDLVVGVIIILISPEYATATIIVQLVFFFLFLLIFSLNMLYGERTEGNERKRAIEVAFIKTSASQVKAMMNVASDATVKKQLGEIYDLMHASPSRSCSAAWQLESEVVALVDELRVLVEKNDVQQSLAKIIKIRHTMEERNRIVALSN